MVTTYSQNLDSSKCIHVTLVSQRPHIPGCNEALLRKVLQIIERVGHLGLVLCPEGVRHYPSFADQIRLQIGRSEMIRKGDATGSGVQYL